MSTPPPKSTIDAMAHSTPITGHRSALTLLVIAYTLSITDRMILSILFPNIRLEFGLSDTQLGVLGGLSFAVFYASLGIPIAKLADKHNRKLIIITSIIIFSLMTVMSGLATGLLTLLLFRIGVGIGEAGVNPASHSIIADYFPAQRRGFAMAILMVGANLGMLIGFIAGGFIAEVYGWRIALMSVGLPGLGLALVMGKLLREPARDNFENGDSAEPPPVGETALAMWRNPALRHLVAGSVIMSILTYGMTQWMPTFFIRSYALSQTEVGLIMAAIFGVLGAIGAIVAGRVFDALSRRGFQLGLTMLATAILISMPFSVLALLSENMTTAMLLFVVPGFTGNFFLGPSFAMIQTLSPSNTRAVASAIQMLLINLVGLGIGPLLVGLLSDALSPVYGEGSISIAMACFTAVSLWGAAHFLLCARAIRRAEIKTR